MCCLETKHNSRPSGWRLEKRDRQTKNEKERKEGKGKKKTQHSSTINKESSVYSVFKDL